MPCIVYTYYVHSISISIVSCTILVCYVVVGTRFTLLVGVFLDTEEQHHLHIHDFPKHTRSFCQLAATWAVLTML